MFPRFILTGDFESKHGLWLTNQNEARKKENAERIKNNQKEIPENDLLDVPWDVFKTQADIGLVLDDDEWRTEQVFKGSVSVEMVNGSIEGADSSGSGADEDQNFAPVTSDAHEQINVNPMRTNKSQKPVDSVIQTALETADSTFPDLDESAAVDGVLALLEKLHGAKAKGLITEAVFEGFKEKYSKQLMALMGAAGGGMGD